MGAADDWIAIAGGGDHHCAIRADDSLWCWGKNNNYELGLGDDESRYEPVEIDFGVGVIDVAASSDHTCAIGTDNSLWCWGRNHDGSLGTGDFDPREMPTEIDGPNNWVELAALGTSTCGLRDDGTIWCWGEGPKVDNFYGPVVTNSPTQVGEDSNWQALIGMPEEPAFLTTPAPIYCGLRTDNTLWCWGGDITWDGEPPAQIGSDDDWKRLAETSHGSHTCAIRNDDSLWCWGSNSAGQLGTGDTTYTPDPAPVDSTDTFSAVATGTNFSVALDASGSLWSFGENADGKLGTGTLYFSVPEQIELP